MAIRQMNLWIRYKKRLKGTEKRLKGTPRPIDLMLMGIVELNSLP